MLSHPDPQVQYIFASLEAQRDNLMVENGNLAAQVAALTKLVPVAESEVADTPESQPN